MTNLPKKYNYQKEWPQFKDMCLVHGLINGGILCKHVEESRQADRHV